MRGGYGKDVAFPFAGGKALRGMQGVHGWMGAAVHPYGALGAPGEVVRMDGYQGLCVAVVFFPEANISETRDIVGGVYAALIFGEGDEGGVPGLGSGAGGGVEGDSAVVTQLGAGEAVGKIFIQTVDPDSGQ